MHYIFDGRRTYNSGTLTRDKAKEILLRVFRDNAELIYNVKPSLFNGLRDQNDNLISNSTKFALFINNPLFSLSHPILDFVEIY